MSEAGVEPAKPAFLAQYLCQFGYTDILVTLGGFEPAVFDLRGRPPGPTRGKRHVVTRAGFEPCEYRIEGPASLPLLHRAKLVGAEGVEPSPRGPRPRILPLYDTPVNETG